MQLGFNIFPSDAVKLFVVHVVRGQVIVLKQSLDRLLGEELRVDQRTVHIENDALDIFNGHRPIRLLALQRRHEQGLGRRWGAGVPRAAGQVRRGQPRRRRERTAV